MRVASSDCSGPVVAQVHPLPARGTARRPRPGEDPPCEHPADSAEKVSLPRDPSRGEKAPEQCSPPHEGDNRREHEVPQAPGEKPSAQEIARVAEDHAARADVDGCRWCEEPGSKPPDDGHDHRHDDEADDATERDEKAEQEEGHSVGQEMAETRVEEGCGQEPDEAAWVAGDYSVAVEPQAAHKVDDLLEPHRRRQSGDHD